MKAPAYLGPEVWLIVFKHMSCVPLAHKKSFETAPTNFQPTLAACCRVSKVRPRRRRCWQYQLFHHLAATYLYIYPIVHSLPLFIVGLTDPAAVVGLKSKGELLARTRILYLEGPLDADVSRPISDEEVEAYAVTVGEKESEQNAERLKAELQRQAFSRQLQTAWRTILDAPNGPSQIFPRLSAVAIGAVDGSGWWPGPEWSGSWAELHTENRDALHDFLNATPSIRHYCQNSSTGMLSLDNRLFFRNTDRDLTLTTHSCIYTPEFRPVCIGIRTNWIIHTDGHLREDSDPELAFRQAESEMEGLLEQREELVGEEEYADITSWGVDVGVYVGLCEGDDADGKEKKDLREWGAEQTKIWEGKLAESRQLLPTGTEAKDSFELFPLFDGFCAACGWTGENAVRPPGWHEAMDEFEEEFKKFPTPQGRFRLV